MRAQAKRSEDNSRSRPITLEQALSALAKDRSADGEAFERALGESLSSLRRELARVGRPKARVGLADSPTLGRLLVALSDQGVAMVCYVERAGDLHQAILRLARKFDLFGDERAAAAVAAELTRYSVGETDQLTYAVDLSLVEGDFSRRALLALKTLWRGAAVTYQGLAAAIGARQKARAVGYAMNLNPVPIFVPCHRVLASDLSLHGYAGGLARKALLLRAEGFELASRPLKLAGELVWANREAKIFCRPSCPSARRADRARMVFFAGADAASRAGMRPCRICRPA